MEQQRLHYYIIGIRRNHGYVYIGDEKKPGLIFIIYEYIYVGEKQNKTKITEGVS